MFFQSFGVSSHLPCHMVFYYFLCLCVTCLSFTLLWQDPSLQYFTIHSPCPLQKQKGPFDPHPHPPHPFQRKGPLVGLLFGDELLHPRSLFVAPSPPDRVMEMSATTSLRDTEDEETIHPSGEGRKRRRSRSSLDLFVFGHSPHHRVSTPPPSSPFPDLSPFPSVLFRL